MRDRRSRALGAGLRGWTGLWLHWGLPSWSRESQSRRSAGATLPRQRRVQQWQTWAALLLPASQININHPSPLAHAARPSGTNVRGAMAVTLVPDPPPWYRSRANQKLGQPPCLAAGCWRPIGQQHDSQAGRRQLAPTHPQRVPPLLPGAVANRLTSRPYQ